MEKQVNRDHYEFDKYIQKPRWISLWHQLNEIIIRNPKNVLEIGPGPGFFKLMLKELSIHVDTVDIDQELKPDIVASATALPIKENTYDCVCAFQMLEHLPYEDSILAFNEMVRVAKKYIIISLPNAKKISTYSLPVPFGKKLQVTIPKMKIGKKYHEFDGQHYWEINKKGYPIKKIVADFGSGKVELINSYRVKENSYHHFLIFRKIDSL